MAGKKAGSAALWIIIGLLVISLAGFGATSFGGSQQTVAEVGDVDITANDYVRAIDAEVSDLSQRVGQPLTFQQARSLGVDRAALQRLVAAAALENEVANLGISAGDAIVAEEIANSPAFQGAAGFDRGIYENALRRNGVSVPEFEEQVRSDIASGILRSAVGSGVTAPDIYVDTLFTWVRQTREVTWARLTADDLPEPLSEPSEDALRAYYDENTEDFTRPETKSIRYAWLTPDMIVDNIEVDDAQLQTLYEERLDEFVQPERRLVERLVFPTEAEAQAARDAIDAGETDFDTLVEERGLSLNDVDLGDVSRLDLEGAADGIFALTEPGVAGPLPSSLGPALFRMNGILAAQETTFEEARADLTAEAAADRARRIIFDTIPQIEDLLAGGADMDILAERTDMQTGAIDWNTDVFDDIAAYSAFRSTAAAADENSFPEVVELEDGGIFALKVDAITPPAPIPFDEVRAAVIEGWETAETQGQLAAYAEELAEQARSGAALETFGLDFQTDAEMRRDGFLEGTPPDFISTLFEMEPGDFRVLSADGDAWLLRLDSITDPDLTTPEAEAARQRFAAQTVVQLSAGMINSYTQALLEETGIEINQSAINAVTAQLP